MLQFENLKHDILDFFFFKIPLNCMKKPLGTKQLLTNFAYFESDFSNF